MRSVHSSGEQQASPEREDRRHADRSPVQQAADVICRSGGPESSLVILPAVVADFSAEGAKLLCQERILHHAIWLRFTPAGGTEQVIEASIRWCRMAGDGPEHGWVYGVRFTARQKDGVLTASLPPTAEPASPLTDTVPGDSGLGDSGLGDSGLADSVLADSVLDDGEVTSATVGDTQIWSNDRAKLLAEYLQAAPRPSVVRPESTALQGLFQAADGSERRISPRYACERSGQVRARLDALEALSISTEDISEYGARILSPEPIDGEHLFLYLPSVSGFPTPVECEIRWRRNQVEGLFCQETRYSYGLRFLSPVPPGVVEMIRAWRGECR